MRQAALVALALLAVAACGRESSAPPSATGTPSAPPSALAPPPSDQPPAELSPLAEVVKQKPGSRVKTRAFLWLMRPSCPPCPPGANCEPCPPAFFQFSEKPNTGAGSEPGAIVLSDFNGSEPKLDVKSEYFLEGALENQPQAKGQPFLRIEKIGILKPTPAK